MNIIVTYNEIRAEYRRLYGKPIIQNCWIADVKRTLGFPMRYSYDRKNRHIPVKPCPNDIIKERLIKIIKGS